MASSIADYALIGDLGTAALVSRTGSIDWLCWPRFDSDACFAALLGTSEHGRWLVAPRDAHARTSRNYRENTLILETRFETSDGAAVLVDFMPPRERDSHLIRIVIGERGSVAFRSELILRFGYGAIIPWGDTRRRSLFARDCRTGHGGVAIISHDARRELQDGRRIYRHRGRVMAFCFVLRSVPSTSTRSG